MCKQEFHKLSTLLRTSGAAFLLLKCNKDGFGFVQCVTAGSSYSNHEKVSSDQAVIREGQWRNVKYIYILFGLFHFLSLL